MVRVERRAHTVDPVGSPVTATCPDDGLGGSVLTKAVGPSRSRDPRVGEFHHVQHLCIVGHCFGGPRPGAVFALVIGQGLRLGGSQHL